MLTPQAHGVAAAQAGVEQHIKPNTLTCSDRPTRLVSCDVIFGPGNEACAFSTGWILYAGGRVDLHHAGIERPAEQPAQGIEKVTRLERCFGTPLSTSDDRARGNLRKRLVTRRFK